MLEKCDSSNKNEWMLLSAFQEGLRQNLSFKAKRARGLLKNGTWNF